jgi:UDP-glucuronate decarboxylase
MKRILVTGGSGFLGSHLCEALLNAGNEVICVDNLFTGSKRNIYHLMDDHRFEFIRHDVTFPLYLEVDEIYNLAYYLHSIFVSKGLFKIETYLSAYLQQ